MSLARRAGATALVVAPVAWACGLFALDLHERPKGRRAGIRYLSWFIAMRCGARVSDPTSGLRAAGRRAIELFARAYPSDYPEPESIPIAIRAGLRVTEQAAAPCL
ncbi:MAG: hypothetical protein E6J82_18535 [Deltaproteobacteria bacterium]|nr:MAG: hypothetical protein E6J82_18535 [Deltaproteobacteria bacterium]